MASDYNELTPLHSTGWTPPTQHGVNAELSAKDDEFYERLYANANRFSDVEIPSTHVKTADELMAEEPVEAGRLSARLPGSRILGKVAVAVASKSYTWLRRGFNAIDPMPMDIKPRTSHHFSLPEIHVGRKTVIVGTCAALAVAAYFSGESSSDQSGPVLKKDASCSAPNQVLFKIGHHSWDGDAGSTTKLMAEDLNSELHTEKQPITAAQIDALNPTVFDRSGDATVYGPTCITLPRPYTK